MTSNALERGLSRRSFITASAAVGEVSFKRMDVHEGKWYPMALPGHRCAAVTITTRHTGDVGVATPHTLIFHILLFLVSA